MQIKFWRPENEHGIFSNFAHTPLVIDGVDYLTAEHYFQAQKTQDSREWAEIVKASSPTLAKRLGGECHMRPDWDTKRCSVMMRVLREKAVQSPEFRKALIDSGDAELIKASPWDAFWGCGRNGSGRNMLGEQLMDIRQMIKDGDL